MWIQLWFKVPFLWNLSLVISEGVTMTNGGGGMGTENDELLSNITLDEDDVLAVEEDDLLSIEHFAGMKAQEKIAANLSEVEVKAQVKPDKNTLWDSPELDITNLYLKSLSRPLLTAEDEVNLANRIRKEDKQAYNTMIESNLRLVVKMAKRYMNKGMPFLDLIAEGNIGLMRAVDKFNPDLGFRFSTYATWWIKQSIERALLNQTRTIRVPIHVLKELNSHLRAIANLRRDINREPSLEEIARHLDKPVEEVKRVLTATKNVESIDEMYDDSSRPVIETISSANSQSPEQEVTKNNLKELLSDWLEYLNENQCTVIAMRFGLRGHDPSTLESIGAQIGLTRERVRQIQIEAMTKLSKIAKSNNVSKELIFSDQHEIEYAEA